MMFNDINKVIKTGRSIDDYQKDYDLIIYEAKNRPNNLDGYFEVHHIIPRCIGGGDDESNLVRLTAKEHIVAHILLHRIFPESVGLSFAAGLMVSVTKVNTVGGYRVVLDEKLETIQSIELDTLAEIRSESHSSLRKPVVCFIGEKIYKIYDSCTETKQDGFSPDTVSSVSERYPRKGFYKGYYWAKLDIFAKNNSKIVEKYFSEGKIETPTPLTKEESDSLRANQQKHKVIVCTEDGEIEHIYESIKDVTSGGFTRATVCNKINSGELYYERLWYTIDEYCIAWPDHKVDYSKEFSEFSSSLIFLKQPAVVAYNKDVCKLYLRIFDTEVDGFNRNAVSQSIKTGGTSGGYYWMRYLDFINRYPNRTPKMDEKIIAVSSSKEVVAANMNGDYIKYYESIGSVEEDGINSESVRQAIKRGEGSLYRGVRWYTKDYYCNNFSIGIEKDISEYLENLPKRERNRKKIVMCDNTGEIVEIYESIESTISNGYKPGNIRKALSRENSTSYGKRWYYLDDYNLKYPEKLKEYESRNTDIDNP